MGCLADTLSPGSPTPSARRSEGGCPGRNGQTLIAFYTWEINCGLLSDKMSTGISGL